jgi:hypothetical protein
MTGHRLRVIGMPAMGSALRFPPLLGTTMTYQDEDYYRARAIEERGAAADAKHANVAQIHEELARLYQALADQPELRPVRKTG